MWVDLQSFIDPLKLIDAVNQIEFFISHSNAMQTDQNRQYYVFCDGAV